MPPPTTAVPPKSPALSALDRPAKNAGELRSLLSRPDVLEQIKLTLPKHMSPDRLTKILLSTCLKTPALMKVNQLSLMQTLTQLSELGLEPGSALGHVYLIPFENKGANRTDVNIIIGYKGLLELMRRSGTVARVATGIAYEDEIWEYEEGLKEMRKFRHVPNLRAPRDESRAFAVYFIAEMKDGSEHLEVMSMAEVRQIRDETQGFKQAKRYNKPPSGPWVEHFTQMARKTIIRRAANYLALSAEMVRAMELEDESESAVSAARSVIDGQVRKPDLGAIINGSSSAASDDIASQMASRPEPEGGAEEAFDATTGEVREEDLPSPVVAQDAPEPEAGTVDHLIWRISRAGSDEFEACKKLAYALPKDEPRRLEVSGALAARKRDWDRDGIRQGKVGGDR